jgi:hypothetical protein
MLRLKSCLPLGYLIGEKGQLLGEAPSENEEIVFGGGAVSGELPE